MLIIEGASMTVRIWYLLFYTGELGISGHYFCVVLTEIDSYSLGISVFEINLGCSVGTWAIKVKNPVAQ